MKAENDFRDYLREIRGRRGWSINKLAIKSGVTSGYLSQLETGKRGTPSATIINKLAKVLGVPTEEMMRQAGYLEGGDPSETTIDLNADMDTEEAERMEPYSLSEVLDIAHEAGKWSSATEMMEFAAWAHPKINGGSLFFMDGGERRSFLRMRVRDERKLWEEGKKK